MTGTKRPLEITRRDGGLPIGYTQLVFPDGQRHITLDEEITNTPVLISASIACADDLFDLLLMKDILDRGHNLVYLYIRYLMGGRMDRPIDSCQPFTLKIVADVINNAGFAEIAVLDPHSAETLVRLDASVSYPHALLQRVLQSYSPGEVIIVIPDDGAIQRAHIMAEGTGFDTFVQCHKMRDSQTGRLSGFTVDNTEKVKGKICIIIDDICDGGGTFVALAKLLRAAGAVHIILFVTHGIFSKGRDLEGIDTVVSTDSYQGLGG